MSRNVGLRGQAARLFRSALALSPALLLIGCIPQGDARDAPAPPRAEAPAPPPVNWAPPPAPRPAPPSPAQVAEKAAQEALAARVRELGRGFNGDIGIAVMDVQTGYITHYDGESHFPQQSVSKFWVALTALDRVDRGHLDLSAPVTVRREDMTLFHQPIAQQIGASGFNTTLGDLMYRAVTQSDNTANDFLLWRAGGPDAVRSFLADKRIHGVRFGPGEREMQSRLAGMEWKQSLSVGRAFYTARANVPQDVRRAAFDAYVRDPVDGATPIGLVRTLARLQKGELLSPDSTQRLLRAMANTRTGPQRLKGGLLPGWTIGHKTGTGQVLGPHQTGYNDIGIVTGPDGKSYAVAVMIRRTAAPIPERMRVMQNTTRAAISYANRLSGGAALAQDVGPALDTSADGEGDGE